MKRIYDTSANILTASPVTLPQFCSPKRLLKMNTTLSPRIKGLEEIWNYRLKLFYKYSLPNLIAFGLIGHMIAIGVFLLSKKRFRSSSVYLTALSVADCCFLLSLIPISLEYFQIELFHIPVFCQLLIFVIQNSAALSVWFVVCFTVERYVAVFLPLKKANWCTTRRARIVVVTLSIFSSFLYLDYPLSLDVQVRLN